MRVVATFEADAKSAARFIRVHAAIHVGSVVEGQKRTLDVYRREAKLLDLLDTISEVNTDKGAMKLPDAAEPRRLRAGGGSLVLDPPDVALIRDRLKIDDLWNAHVAREVTDTFDWLGTLPAAEAAE